MGLDLHQRIMGAAEENKRSATAEINARLEGSFSPAPDIGRHLQSLVARYEQELAEAEVDKHILYLMLVEVAFNQKILANTLGKHRETIPEALALIAEWEAETNELLAQAQAKLSMPLEEAKQKFEEATERLMASFKQRREAAAALLPGASTKASASGD
jgi:hypothetical protein